MHSKDSIGKLFHEFVKRLIEVWDNANVTIAADMKLFISKSILPNIAIWLMRCILSDSFLAERICVMKYSVLALKRSIQDRVVSFTLQYLGRSHALCKNSKIGIERNMAWSINVICFATISIGISKNTICNEVYMGSIDSTIWSHGVWSIVQFITPPTPDGQ